MHRRGSEASLKAFERCDAPIGHAVSENLISNAQIKRNSISIAKKIRYLTAVTGGRA